MNVLADFPMLNKDIIYLDNGATTFKPQCVIDSITEYYSSYTANAHRGDYNISLKVDIAYEGTRDKVQKFINAKHREEIIFTSGATESLNMITEGFFAHVLEAGDEVIISEAEHASNVLPWFKLAQKKGIIIKYVPLDNEFHITLEAVKRTVTSKTKVIALAEVTNVIGDVRPIDEITAFAHTHDIFMVVDGAQSVPHKKTDVQSSDVDFLVFSAHKMCGPTGVGVLYGKIELLNDLEPINMGGGMNESFDNENAIFLKELPTRLEAGTPNIAGVIGFGSAIDYLTHIGMENITYQEMILKKYALEKLSNIKHIDLITTECDSGIIAFNVDDIFPQDVAIYLDKYNVCVRAGNHCAKILKKSIGVRNTIRVSLYFYNTKEDIDRLVELLSDKDKILKEMI